MNILKKLADKLMGGSSSPNTPGANRFLFGDNNPAAPPVEPMKKPVPAPTSKPESILPEFKPATSGPLQGPKDSHILVESPYRNLEFPESTEVAPHIPAPSGYYESTEIVPNVPAPSGYYESTANELGESPPILNMSLEPVQTTIEEDHVIPEKPPAAVKEDKEESEALTSFVDTVEEWVIPKANAAGITPDMEEIEIINRSMLLAAKHHNVDTGLIAAMIEQESMWNPKAVSHVGAKGLMQLMPGTAKDMGVKDPFNPFDNVMGGTRYIKKLLDRYSGDVKLALAAYNAGMGNVKKYGGVPPFKETQNYIKKIKQRLEKFGSPIAQKL